METEDGNDEDAEGVVHAGISGGGGEAGCGDWALGGCGGKATVGAKEQSGELGQGIKGRQVGEIRRFLVGPVNCEITGVVCTPDMRTMFVNIQHPGESPTDRSDPADPSKYSTWPSGRAGDRPRSATVIIRKKDGGLIGT